MTQTLNTRQSAASSITASPSASRRLLAGAVVAGPLFLGAGIVQGFAREGFDFTRNAISQLALGDLGWIQTVNFVVTSALLLIGSIGLRRVLRREPGGTWGPVLIAVFGASFLVAAVFQADAGGGFPVGSPDVGTMSAHGAGHMAAWGSATSRCPPRSSSWPVHWRPGVTAAGPWPPGSHRSSSSPDSWPPRPRSWCSPSEAGSGLCWLAAVAVRLLTGASPERG